MSKRPKQTQRMADQPPDTTILVTNVEPGQNWIVMPTSGYLWVGYEYATQPAEQVFIWHQGGAETQVPPGFNVYPIGAEDALVYQLGDDPDLSIKLGWAYVASGVVSGSL
jgi:hypothetical protein